ncbi:MAG: holin family protein [Alphaproteobacteria bacterium]
MTWTLLIDPISRLLDKIIPDPEARAKAQIELMKSSRELDLEELRLAISADSAQTAINHAEAQHPNLFVAGWRPFIGWVCGVAFCYHFVIQPLLAFTLANSGHVVMLPEFNMQELTTVLMGILGLGGLRTIEKIRRRA